MSDDVYEKLAAHLQALGMGYPPKDELREILVESFSPIEAEVALAIPTRGHPPPTGSLIRDRRRPPHAERRVETISPPSPTGGCSSREGRPRAR